MDETTKTVVLCETKTSGSQVLFDLLRQDLTEAYFVYYNFSQLLQMRTELQPHTIVCDFSTVSFQEALSGVQLLRKTFPESGIVIYRNITDLEPETFQYRFVTCYDYLLREMVQRGKNMRALTDHAFRLIQR